jgi:biopolymer transport protein TolQ
MDPQTAINSVQLAGSVTGNDMSILGLFSHADLIGKTVITGLLIISIFTWAIIFDKITKLSRLKKRAAYFEERFWSAGSLDMLYDKIKRPADPMQAVFVAGMKEWRSASDKGLFANPGNRNTIQARVDRILSVTIGREMATIETWMTFLASVGSVAPFIGLFGTVWGIMHSFIGIAQAQNTSLAVVAPGIAEALLATAIGLVAAIPATTAFNKFSTEITRYGARLDNFANDFVATLSRNLESGKGGRVEGEGGSGETGWVRR